MNSSLHHLKLAAVVAWTAMVASLLPASAGASVETLLRPADVRSVVVSPNGGHLAMIRSDADKDTLVIFKRPEMKVATGVSSRPGQRFATITWVNSARLLIEPAKETAAIARLAPTGALLAISIDGSKSALLPGHAGKSVLETSMVNVLPDDQQHVLVAARGICEPEVCTEDEAKMRRLVKLNVMTGEKTTVGDPLAIDAYYVSGPAGKRVMAAGRAADGRVEVYRLAGGIWTQVTTFDPRSDLGTVPFAIDESGTTFALANKVGPAALYRWDLESGETSEVYRGAKSDIDAQVLSFGGRALLAVRSDPGFPSWHYLEPDSAFTGTHKSLRAAFPDADVDVTSFTADGVEAVVRVHGDRNSGDFYIVNTKTRESNLLATSRPWLPADSLAVMEPLELTTRDMFGLRGYVTKPADEGPHPMVVIVHDEPYSTRVRWAFDPEVQMLAERGFAVLQINYRGSAGLGQYYASSGGESNGRAVQRDIADATKWAVDQTIAVPDRICIYGRGYGGFAALKAIAPNTRQLRCAVAIDGIYDLSDSPALPESPELSPQSLLNVPSPLDMADANRSPLARVGSISTPIMLVGDDAQTTGMRDALQAAEKSVAWRVGDEEAADFEAVLDYLQTQLGGVVQPQVEPDETFGTSLGTQQRRQFEAVVERMHEDAKALAKRRWPSLGALRREIRKIVDRRDKEVREIVSNKQWALYPAFKPNLVQQIEARIDTSTLR